jgi:hypothetical protein
VKKPLIVAGLVIGALFLIRDVGFGIYRGYHEGQARRLRIEANLAAFRQASAALKQVKESVTATRLRGPRTVDQYAANCRAVGPAVAQWRQSLEEARRVLFELERDSKAARDPGWDALGPIFLKACALDAEQLPLVERQIQLAEPLETLPPGERSAYFDAKIQPLLDAEVEIESRKEAAQQELQAALAKMKTKG